MRSLKPQAAVAAAEGQAASAASDAARLLAQGEVAEAIELIEAVRRYDPANPQIRFLLAFAAWRMFDLVQAMRLLGELADELPRNGTVAESLATLKALVGDLDESLFYGKLGTALPADPALQSLIPPDFPGFGDAFLGINERPLVAAAFGLESQGRLREAVRALEQHVRLFPTDRSPAERLIALLLQTGREAEAVQHIGALAGERDGGALSLMARGSMAIGDAAGSARLHAEAVRAAPSDPAIRAAAVRDAFWSEADGEARRDLTRDWLRRFAAGPRSTRPRGQHGTLPRIGYLVAGVAGTPLAATVAAVARQHDRTKVEIRGFGYGELSAESNVALRGGFDDWRDMSRLDPRTLALMLEREALDLVIDASGLRSPGGLTALSIANLPIRCGWLGLEPGMPDAPYDCWLACDGLVADGAVLRSLGGSHIPASGKPIPRLEAVGAGLRLGLDILPRELTEGAVDVVMRMLDAVPAAQLVLLDNGFSQPIVIDRLVASLGPAASRVDVVKAAEARAFLAQVDVAIVPPTVETARSVAEAIGHGVPAVVVGHPAGMALARNAGLSDLAVADAAAAAAKVASLAADPAALAEAWRLAQAATPAFVPARIAGEIEQLAHEVERRHAAG